MQTYLALLEHDGPAWSGTFPELEHITVSGKTRAQTLERLSQALALHLYGLEELGQRAAPPVARRLEDLSPEYLEDFEGSEIEAVLLEPVPLNRVAFEVAAALEASGLSDSEVARRMGAAPASIHRLKSPFYWGHSLDSLRRLVNAVGRPLTLTLEPAPNAAD